MQMNEKSFYINADAREMRIGRFNAEKKKERERGDKIHDLLINYTLLKCVTEVCEM